MKRNKPSAKASKALRLLSRFASFDEAHLYASLIGAFGDFGVSFPAHEVFWVTDRGRWVLGLARSGRCSYQSREQNSVVTDICYSDVLPWKVN